ncbi:DNA-binding transcriptional regulator BolA-like [Mytilus californianus]|uniref:DNA-binding transcriptional regulator BolA-like n=1 Tax=Mytilus californianus TaxID=6549 RepID=UPI0022470B83|nr:DNA-binding transcriptional regulator BolA-like [Mytilus californianus]
MLKGIRRLSQNYKLNLCHMSQMAESAVQKPVESSITKKLTEGLRPQHLEVINESYMHNVPKGSESHFKVVVISDMFEGQPLIKRHRMINENLADELQGSVHALSITAKTPKQWEDSGQVVGKSPPCQGGSGL